MTTQQVRTFGFPLFVGVLLLTGCGSDGALDSATSDQATSTASTENSESEEGLVVVRLQPVEGVFIEGFEIGLRFETVDGAVIYSTLWTDFVADQSDEPSLEAYYESVLEQPVPAGDVVLFAEANVGAGPAPEIPDLTGPLPCRLDLQVQEGGRVEVEVLFTGDAKCLRLG